MMPEKEDCVDRFVKHLEKLRKQDDRGALAALRRGLGSPPGTVPAMYPHILPWIPQNRWIEDACYIVGSLFAYHRQPGGAGTMGKAFSLVKDRNESLEKRFVALLNCHRDDLPHYLRQAVSLLKAKEIPVDWRQLIRDILNWDRESRSVQQQWAREFWQGEVQEIGAEVKLMGAS